MPRFGPIKRKDLKELPLARRKSLSVFAVNSSFTSKKDCNRREFITLIDEAIQPDVIRLASH
ncbi:MAG: hypothetical protein QOJ02_2401 [Acidobacteriota bacterium]|jgi:hypothetical protein|nr:hypothetical protein [Acidobacteriota bacterium]